MLISSISFYQASSRIPTLLANNAGAYLALERFILF